LHGTIPPQDLGGRDSHTAVSSPEVPLLYPPDEVLHRNPCRRAAAAVGAQAPCISQRVLMSAAGVHNMSLRSRPVWAQLRWPDDILGACSAGGPRGKQRSAVHHLPRAEQ